MPNSPETWKKIKEVFEDASAQPEAERAVYLDNACGGDGNLRSEVESLLSSLTRSGKFLEPPVVESQSGVADKNQPDIHLGKHFGPYRIEELIGHGGMGAVYRAVRDDGQFLKQVAIKLIRPGAWSSELGERFLQEKQTLARLEHPNIAGLLDSGTTEDGTPYLVMEFVDGTPIDRYCDEGKLSVTRRLELFRVVCSAVQYAHQNLVVHRDLKPGNILVTAGGTPKLLDFGIAKLLDATQNEAADITKIGLRFVTLEYASPEQIKGEAVTTASDVYSLGVLLYKLLTGRSPYRFKSRLPHEMTRTVCEQEPLKPSTNPQRLEQPSSASSLDETGSLRGVSTEKLRRQLSGDIDNILLRSLQKDPLRRYASVAQLSEDIHRHLNGLPVLARPDTIGYRTTKFVQRHAIGVAATAVILLAVVGGVIGVLWQANKTAKEAAKAAQINSFLQEMLASADPAKSGKDVTVAQTLDKAVDRVDSELGSQPEIAASVLHTIGETYISLGLYDKASRQLDKVLRLRHAALGDNHEDISTALHSLAYLAQLKSEYALADSLYQAAIAMHRKTHPDPDQHLVAMLSDYGTLLRDQRKSDRAIIVLKESVELCRTIDGDQSKPYAISLSNLGPALNDKHELAEAESVYSKALAILRRCLGADHIDVAQAENNLAFVFAEKGDYDTAEKLFRHSLAVRRKALGENHPEVGVALINLSGVMLKRGDLLEAGKLSGEAVANLRKSVDPDNVMLSSALLMSGRVMNDKGQPEAAEADLREALHIREKVFPPGHFVIAMTRSELGRSLAGQHRFDEAEAELREAYASLQSSKGEHDPVTIDAAKALIALYEQWGRKEKADVLKAKIAASNQD